MNHYDAWTYLHAGLHLHCQPRQLNGDSWQPQLVVCDPHGVVLAEPVSVPLVERVFGSEVLAATHALQVGMQWLEARGIGNVWSTASGPASNQELRIR